jgi:CRP-like cAMP-binding protein
MSQKDTILQAVILQEFQAGYAIVHEGDPGDIFYLITSGEVSVKKQEVEVRRFGHGDFFGEMALLYDCPRTATIETMTEVHCMSLGRADLQVLLGDQLSPVLYRNSARVALEKNLTMEKLSKVQHDQIISRLEFFQHQDGEVAIEAGTPFGHFGWIVLRG